jgi:hypothetical protein
MISPARDPERRAATSGHERGIDGRHGQSTIFRAALHASDAYDRQITELAAHPQNGSYEALIVSDVRRSSPSRCRIRPRVKVSKMLLLCTMILALLPIEWLL